MINQLNAFFFFLSELKSIASHESDTYKQLEKSSRLKQDDTNQFTLDSIIKSHSNLPKDKLIKQDSDTEIKQYFASQSNKKPNSVDHESNTIKDRPVNDQPIDSDTTLLEDNILDNSNADGSEISDMKKNENKGQTTTETATNGGPSPTFSTSTKDSSLKVIYFDDTEHTTDSEHSKGK